MRFRFSTVSVNDTQFFVGFTGTSETIHPVAVVARYKAWVCGRSIPGMAVSNPAGCMSVSVVCSCVDK